MAKDKTKREAIPLRVNMTDWETEDSLLLLRSWKREGLTDECIAKNKIGVSHQTLLNWKHKSPLILGALKKAREDFHKELEDSMYKRALGFYVDEWVEEYRYDEHGNEFLTYRKKNRKYIPPSETMQIFLSKHDIRGKWLDEKTDADKKEQDARIAKLQKEAREEDNTNEIKVIIEGGESYAE